MDMKINRARMGHFFDAIRVSYAFYKVPKFSLNSKHRIHVTLAITQTALTLCHIDCGPEVLAGTCVTDGWCDVWQNEELTGRLLQ